jgi:hypothetical protein
MDNITLSKEQLYKLIGFIKRRGFHQPHVIVEILDHFACKVEEKMNLFPNLSLEAAMTEAHSEFGRLGFYPIVTAYEAGVKKKYNDLYKAERNNVLLNPLYMLAAILSAVFYYKGFVWAEINEYRHVFGSNDVSALLYFASFITPILILLKFKSIKAKDPILNAIFRRDMWIYILIFSVTYQTGPHVGRGALFLQITGTFAAFYFVICQATMYAAMKRGSEDSAIVYDYLKSMG